HNSTRISRMTQSFVEALQVLQKLEALLEIGLRLVQAVHTNQETFRSGRPSGALHNPNAEPDFVHRMQGTGSEVLEPLRRCSTHTFSYLRNELTRNLREGALRVQEGHDRQQTKGCSTV